ncbi:MAG: phospholipase D family protein [bacterium]|nr:phospholipase D family protein [bacterium]
MNRIFIPFLLPALAHAETYEYAFSPHGQSLPLVLKTIQSAQKEILVAGYTFTSKPVSVALLEAHKRGVSVSVVVDEKSNRHFTAAQFLANAGVPVRTDSHYPIMHNKFIVVDGVTIETGSFNYSAAAANKNAENVLVIHGAPDLAGSYAQEWRRLWNESADLPTKY